MVFLEYQEGSLGRKPKWILGIRRAQRSRVMQKLGKYSRGSKRGPHA
jgi:hypothetical protein